MSSSNCCFLTRIQISQEAGQVVWYSHLFQNFPQFIVIRIVNKAEEAFACIAGSQVEVATNSCVLALFVLKLLP